MSPFRSRASRTVRLLLLAGVTGLLGRALRAQDGANDPTFNVFDTGDFGDGVEAGGSVFNVVVQPDGRSLIAGHFVTYQGIQRPRLARIDPDGALDTTFAPPMFPSAMRAIALQPNGRILVGGFSPMQRLNADGTIDASFQVGAGPVGEVRALAVQPDGRILVAGDFTTWNGAARGRIARVNADGSLDGSFLSSIGAGASIRSIALQPDGRVVVGGAFQTYDGVPRDRIARLHADGSLDATFDAGAVLFGLVERVLAQPNGGVLVAGSFTSVQGFPRNRIARLQAHGGLDLTYDPGAGADGTVFALAAQPDGRAVIGGSFTNCGGVVRNRVARLNVDGSLDPTFDPGPGANVSILGVAVQADGQILIGGAFASYGGVVRRGIARTNTDGSRDITFNRSGGASGIVRDVALQVDGKALIGGEFTEYNGVARTRVARLEADGSLDASFVTASGADGTVQAVAVQPDGRALIGGYFASYDGVARTKLARLHADGSLDASFVPGVAASSSAIVDIALQTDGKVLVAGTFATPGHPIVGVARLNDDGGLDPTFTVGWGVNDALHTVVVQPDGKILAAGRFTTYQDVPCNRLVRLNSDGTRDPNFVIASGADFAILAVAVQPDGRLLLGGDFGGIGGVFRPKVARLLSDGTFDPSFAPLYGPDRTVRALALLPDGQVLIAGDFTSVNVDTRNRVARLRADGSTDASFDPGAGPNDSVHGLLVQPDGRALLAGAFTRYDGAARHRIARIAATVPYATACFGVGGTACPCGNSGGAGNGCASSLNPDGAHLGASGSASLANDTLVLSGSGMPDSSALYFQGTAPQNGGLGTLFGHGLRCVGGSVTRLGTRLNSAGASTYPAAGDAPVSVRGGVAAPGVRYYQVWYRNAASFCTPSTFNLTNGLSVTWQP